MQCASDAGYLRRRSQLPRRLCADLAVESCSAICPLRCNDGNLSRRKRHARRAGISAQHLPDRRSQSVPELSVRICVSNLRRQLHARSRARCNCAAGCAADSPHRCSTPIQNPSTMMRMLGGQGHVTRQRAKPECASSSTPPALQLRHIAQNWLDLRAERALSTFDQRHLLNLQAQYTSGAGLDGGTLMSGWRGRLLKEWTLLDAHCRRHRNAGDADLSRRRSRHRIHGTIRPNLTGAPIYSFGDRPASQCSGITPRRCPGNGERRARFHYRPRPVQPRQLARAHISPEHALLSGSPAWTRRTCSITVSSPSWIHDRQQHAIRPARWPPTPCAACKPR